jgi:hypothetical protein
MNRESLKHFGEQDNTLLRGGTIMKMDKETQEGMKNLDFTAHVSDIVANASGEQDAEFSEKQQTVETKDKR